MKVKVFGSNSSKLIESQINRWLEGKDIVVVKIAQSQSESAGMGGLRQITISIWYEEFVPVGVEEENAPS